ncbi:MAG: hypothetical protein MK110_16740, partial [Fuerstiella sp.]|nr:hypothetical protein [Fuerstiella sp.]
MRNVLSFAVAVMMAASVQAGCFGGGKASSCCAAPCTSCCSPCGLGDGGAGCDSVSSCGSSCSSDCGTWEAVEKTIMVPEMVTELRTVTVMVPHTEERSGTR